MNQNDNGKEEKKKGFIPFFQRLFGSGSRAGSSLGGAAVRGAGGAAARAGASFGGAAARGGLAALFSTKAGMVGMILGAATIAAGIGVLYNFIGPSSSGKAYNQGLFQDSYYEEQAQSANAERMGQAAVNSKSSIDMFKEQAQKEGMAMDEEEGKNKDEEARAEEEGGADDSADAPPVVDNAPGYGGGPAGKLQASLGFGGAGGGKLQTSGGMFGGIAQNFAPVYRPNKVAARGSGKPMKGGLKASVTGRKYSVPGRGGKGAFGQAKFAKKAGAKAAYAAKASDAKVGAGVGFDTMQPQTGDVAAPGGGVGLDGSGVDPNGNSLGSVNDPTLSEDNSGPNEGVNTNTDKEKDNPWQKMEDIALYGMLASAVLIFITKILAKKARAAIGTPAFAALYAAAQVTAYLAMAAAAAVLIAGLGFMTGKNMFGGENFDPQKWTGVMYMIAGGMLIYQAYEALNSLGEMKSANQKVTDFTKTIQDQAAKDSFNKLPLDQKLTIADGGKAWSFNGSEWVKTPPQAKAPPPSNPIIPSSPPTTVKT